MRSPVLKIFLVCIFPLLLSCPSSFLFYPNRNIATTPDRSGFIYEDVNFDTEDNVRLNGWWVPAGYAGYTVLFSHGNAGNISHRMDSIKIFHELMLNVFIYDYRGYGMSGGTPSEKGTYLDVEAAWNYLVKARGIDPGRIILFGRSLGGAIACYAAVKFFPAMVILESTFTSAAQVANHHFPFLPGRLLLPDTYNTLERIQYLHSPLLVVHSRGDEVVPFEHGQRLFRVAAVEKYFLEITGGHNSGFMESLKTYREGIREFISREKK